MMPELSTLTDEKLVEWIRNQHLKDYKEIVIRYQDKLKRYILYITKDENMSNDILQNTFIKTYQNLNGFDTKRKFSSWIYRIAHNEAMNLLVKNKKTISLTTEHIDLIETRDSTQVDVIFEKEEMVRVLNKLIDQIPIHYREPLVLYYYEDNSYEEISDILHIPVNTVSSRINRAKKALYELVAESKLLQNG